MPVDVEMFLSATRHNLFSYSPFVNDRFSLTNGYDDRDYSSSLSLSKNHFYVRSTPRRFGFIQERPVYGSYESAIQSKSKSKNTNVELSDGTRKKKVSFADDKGLNLVEVREIPGSPKWTDQVLTFLTGGTNKQLLSGRHWKLASEHPPWEDETLVAHLEQRMVILESVSVKKGKDSILNGTIKVKNLAYEKNIVIRITFDRWISYSDIKATYVRPKIKKPKAESYDTFSFSTKISSTAVRYEVIEFCVCFQCNRNQYWDNNGGINYRLVVDSSNETTTSVNQCDKLSDSQITLSLTENIENISEIDAWGSFMYNQPYW